MVCWWMWRLRVVRGSDDHSPPPSQLLRDLDNCNSDPVAVASCFVERVRRAGCLPLVLFCWGLGGTGTPTFLGGPLQGKCQVSCLEWGGCSWVEPRVAGGWHVPGRGVQRWVCRVALGPGAGLGHTWVYSPMGVSLKSLFLVSP